MYDERFARQYRYEPPSEFPLTLPSTGIVHHLSGPNRYAHTQTSRNRSVAGAKESQQLLSLRKQVCHPCTCTHVRLLGPCFKTGRRKPFRHREAGQRPSPGFHRSGDLLPTPSKTPTRRTGGDTEWEQHRERPGRDPSAHGNLPSRTSSIRFPFSNFRHF